MIPANRALDEADSAEITLTKIRTCVNQKKRARRQKLLFHLAAIVLAIFGVLTYLLSAIGIHKLL